MTSVYQSTSETNSKSKRAYHSCESNMFFFHICVTDFDGESLDFDIEAQDYSQANELAESYCNSIGFYIYNMEIYLFN